MAAKSERILEVKGGRLVPSKRKKTVDFTEPITRYGKKYFYETTRYSKTSANDEAIRMKNYGRWGFLVRIIPEKFAPGKTRYHLYTRSRKPGVE